MRRPSTPSTPGKHPKQECRVRIIGGCWRGRKLDFPDSAGLRPTSDRVRETLFNWLAPVLPGASCLDLFAGSGALGFEALSRGAVSCVMVERNPLVLRHLGESVRKLDAAGARLVQADSMQWIGTSHEQFDVVFIDPPFGNDLLVPARIVSLLDARGLLSAAPWVYVEQSSSTDQQLPDGFSAFRQQRAGNVSYGLWRRIGGAL